MGYRDMVVAAYNAGHSYSDLQAHHEAQGWEAPPRPPLDRIMQGGSLTPEEDWLQGFGPKPNAPSFDESQQLPPSADTHTGTDFAASQTASDAQAPGITLPGTGDQETSGETAPWEVPDTRPGNTGLLNLSDQPNAGPAQDI